MDKERYYNYLWFISPIWNWAISLPFIFIWESAYLAFGLTPPTSPVWIHMFIGIVCTYGLSYFLVYKDRDKYPGLVIMGIIGKILVFIILLAYSIMGHIPFIMALIGTVDLVFACLYIEFYLKKFR